MGTKYRITHKSEHGAFWDGKRAVRTIETYDAERAERLRKAGHKVESVTLPTPKPEAKKPRSKKASAE